MNALSIRFGRGARSRLPADIALALIPSLPRPVLERLVQTLIDRLDLADGDGDLEPEETDHTGGEDDFSPAIGLWDGPGCPISDMDIGADDSGEPDGDECDGSGIEDDWPQGATAPVSLNYKWSPAP